MRTATLICTNCNSPNRVKERETPGKYRCGKCGESLKNPFQEAERPWDPTEIGPMDRCLRCFTPLSEAKAYCSYCGHISTVFSGYVEAGTAKCSIHPENSAVGICCLCDEAICSNCSDPERQHFSLSAGGRELYYCVNCVADSENIAAQFENSNNNCCAKHHSAKSDRRCKDCDLPLCPDCSYYMDKGWIRKKQGDGPFCLSCFRMATKDGGRSNWMSGRDAM